jgi:hypothetical protein
VEDLVENPGPVSPATCLYNCQTSGGCSVKIQSSEPVNGNTLGSCFSQDFGGSCSGIPERSCKIGFLVNVYMTMGFHCLLTRIIGFKVCQTPGCFLNQILAICSRSMDVWVDNIQIDEYSGVQIFVSMNIQVDKYSG